MPSRLRGLELIVKVSKYCNLRCSYCYEYNELANKRRMSLEQLRAFFEHVADTASDFGRDQIRFIWHGGEPLLLPPDYYHSIGQLQREILPPELKFTNHVQTNLTVL